MQKWRAIKQQKGLLNGWAGYDKQLFILVYSLAVQKSLLARQSTLVLSLSFARR